MRIILILSLLVMISCSTSKRIASYPIVTIALPNNEEGTIVIRSSGQGDNEFDAVLNAEKKAFNTLFFHGFSSSIQTRAIIENENQVRQTSPKFFDSFFANGTYKEFIVNTSNYTNIQRVGKYYYLNRDLKINLRSLKIYLENNGIIRKFGY